MKRREKEKHKIEKQRNGERKTNKKRIERHKSK